MGGGCQGLVYRFSAFWLRSVTWTVVILLIAGFVKIKDEMTNDRDDGVLLEPRTVRTSGSSRSFYKSQGQADRAGV